MSGAVLQASRSAQRRTLEVLTRVLGVPLYDRDRGLYRWPCPICGGGLNDPIWRPLVLVEARGDAVDGRLFCEASLDRGFARAMCNFTVERLQAAIA
jgi:hypothetical protein